MIVKFNLKNVRNKHKLTQNELSKKTGIIQQTLSKYERGTIIPQIDTAAKIAAALGVSLDELVIIYEAKEKVAKRLKSIIKD